MLTDDYIAGFFDGEGCVRLQTHNDRRGKGYSYIEAQIEITSCDKHILEEIQKTVGCGKIREKDNHKRGNNHCYKLVFSKQSEMLEVLKRIYPMLRIKHDACSKVIKFLEDKSSFSKGI